jgi:hypothetical protein
MVNNAAVPLASSRTPDRAVGHLDAGGANVIARSRSRLSRGEALHFVVGEFLRHRDLRDDASGVVAVAAFEFSPPSRHLGREDKMLQRRQPPWAAQAGNDWRESSRRSVQFAQLPDVWSRGKHEVFGLQGVSGDLVDRAAA